MKIPMSIFKEIEQKKYQICMEPPMILNSQSNPAKKKNTKTKTNQKNEARSIRVPDLKLYSRAMIIKTTWYWQKNRAQK